MIARSGLFNGGVGHGMRSGVPIAARFQRPSVWLSGAGDEAVDCWRKWGQSGQQMADKMQDFNVLSYLSRPIRAFP